METFWDFSVRTYREPGVADACLALQDEHGADVNLLLYCCWAGWYNDALDQNTFNQALGFSQTWAENVVRPLRGVRRWMKADGCGNKLLDFEICQDVRERVKATELRAEKLQQEALEALPLQSLKENRIPAGPRAVAANLRRYCQEAGIAWSEEVRSKLGIILRAAFPRDSIAELGG